MIDKDAVRSRVKAARAQRTEAELESARSAIRAHILTYCSDHDLPAGSIVAAFEPLRTEPGSVELLASLAAAGYQVIVPVTLPDRDLDWLPWTAAGAEAGQSLGLDAISRARLVLAPAFAVDRAGNRLGRGGGSYDRALSRVPQGVLTAALLFDGEVLQEVPTEAWDRPVSAAVTPAGWIQLTPGGQRNS